MLNQDNPFLDLVILDGRTVKFSKRETQCIHRLLTGHTAQETATQLQLSKRTIEFYLNNVKVKCSCYRKSELIKKLIRHNFIKQITG